MDEDLLNQYASELSKNQKKKHNNPLPVTFHDPNTPEDTAKYLMKLIMDHLEEWEKLQKQCHDK
jgi:hypothetical protein